MMEFIVASEGCSSQCKTTLHRGKNLFITRVSHECDKLLRMEVFSVSCLCVLPVCAPYIHLSRCI